MRPTPRPLDLQPGETRLKMEEARVEGLVRSSNASPARNDVGKGCRRLQPGTSCGASRGGDLCLQLSERGRRSPHVRRPPCGLWGPGEGCVAGRVAPLGSGRLLPWRFLRFVLQWQRTLSPQTVIW
uniref:Suppressor of cytokine signaling 6 n=1 Tax=Rousettus aegyptiacus TaxID=9407 RepID=A0A7J8ELU7_ROUAE|nr:suppressor of cytokine signaling 6 [Rousettus aegyptiacus]